MSISRREWLAVAGAGMVAGQTKRSVAVDEFDYSAVMTAAQAIFGTQVNLGVGIRALLVKRIAQDGKFTIVERAKVNTLIKEQDFGASGRVKKGTQARIGQIRGADYTLMGDIVVFGRDDRSTRVGGGVGGRGGGGLGGVGSAEGKAVVVIDFRLVDNESSEVVMTGEARGESKRVSRGGFGGFWGGGVAGGGGAAMTASNYGETIIGEATMAACDLLAQQISQQSAQASGAKNVEIEAQVATVEGGSVIITAGSAAGVQVGDRFEVQRVLREVRDPQTKEVLDVVTQPVGEFRVATVREKISIGSMTGGPAKEGDRVVKK
jgi:curli biogenesis system outer membrane secretion channel CsgG